MFFAYKVFEERGSEQVSFDSARVYYDGDNVFIRKTLQAVLHMESGKANLHCEEIRLVQEIPQHIIEAANGICSVGYHVPEETYAVEIGKVTTLYGANDRSLIYALMTLKHMARAGNLRPAFVYDYPHMKIRGFHYFVPGQSTIEDLKKMIEEFLVYYKYNHLILEVGGGMEYKRHPKINQAWEEYAGRLVRESGLADRIQHYTYPWSKNAIHPEVGAGSYISQDEVRELVEFCRERGIEVIPEIPSLSHADYIVRAYPELNERVEDQDPDTYCPSNPKTYEIMYDIIDEVFDVFKPSKYIAIGHDEVVTIGLCEKCKDKDPVELFLSDIAKLRSYIESKYCKTIMYGDKFTELYLDGKPYIDAKGKLCGGLQGYEKGDSRYVPALCTAIEKLPRDILIADWYHVFNFDDRFSDFEVMYANFTGAQFADWSTRSNRKNIIGASVSNWGKNDEIHMKRNLTALRLAETAYMQWNSNTDGGAQIRRKAVEEIADHYAAALENKKTITIIHNTDHYIKHRGYVDGDFAVPQELTIGYYRIYYANGTEVKIPIIYGENISNGTIPMDVLNDDYAELCGSVRTEAIDGNTFYKWEFLDPFPKVSIVKIELEEPKANINIREILY